MYLITIDVDWAEDWMIRKVVNILIENNVKATWFITHDSKETKNLHNYSKLFEVGIHPYIHKDSTQGDNPEDIMVALLSLAPHSKSIRFHRFLHSEQMLEMARKFDFRYDSSIFCPFMPNLQPHKLYFEDGTYIIRVPSYYEDYQELLRPNKSFDVTDQKYHKEGLKVFVFHPIHIAYNTSSIYDYAVMKKSKIEVEGNEDKVGARTLFEALVRLISKRKQYTISELAEEWNESREL